ATGARHHSHQCQSPDSDAHCARHGVRAARGTSLEVDSTDGVVWSCDDHVRTRPWAPIECINAENNAADDPSTHLVAAPTCAADVSCRRDVLEVGGTHQMWHSNGGSASSIVANRHPSRVA